MVVWHYRRICAATGLYQFMNLSTARSEKRAKEVGIRKTLGSIRQQLIGQFLSESILMAFLAFVLALTWVLLACPNSMK
jgi:ABC-type antimicrobial peptide transport system permease subunit